MFPFIGNFALSGDLTWPLLSRKNKIEIEFLCNSEAQKRTESLLINLYETLNIPG